VESETTREKVVVEEDKRIVTIGTRGGSGIQRQARRTRGMDNDGSHDILLVQALVGRGPSEFGVAAAGMTHFCVAIDSHSYLPILGIPLLQSLIFASCFKLLISYSTHSTYSHTTDATTIKHCT
jgi:hypothetical protein